MKRVYKGFTLIEITLVMVLIAILLAITTPLVSSVVARNDVGVAHEALYNGLLRAQQLSKNNYQNSQWRVCIDNTDNQYTITSGTCSDPTNAEIIKISSNITISSEQNLDIAFKAISGELDSTFNSITITLSGGGVSKSILITKDGIIDKALSAESAYTPQPKFTATSCTYENKKITIPYTAGEVGYNYASQKINSTGVTGLTATLLGDGPLATGGDTTTDITVGEDTYRVHTFTTVGTSSLNVIQGGEFEYLVVGGGGGGGSDIGGGGGAGGVLQGSISLASNQHNISVGGGGSGATGYNNTPPPGSSGGNSNAFGLITAIGGGGGSSGHYEYGAYAGPPPTSGGSGGGASARYGNVTMPGAAGIPGQGTRGGSGIYSGDYYSGGGGGAGSNTEVDAVNGTRAGNGGNGGSSVIMGTAYLFGGGGGGAGHTGGPAGNGGQGGGGGGSRWTGGVVGTGGTGGLNNGTNGANAYSKGGNGGQNTGSGGGGGSHQGPGGNGGSGIVIVRYKLGGTLSDSGTLAYTVTGSPSGAGSANFNLSNIGNMGAVCNSNIAINVIKGTIATGIATGGTVTDITVGADTYRVHTFTTVGTSSLNVIQGGEFEYLVVAGGGGGGGFGGGGGGAGGFREGSLSLSAGSVAVTVGAGGAPGGTTHGSSGADSVFSSITSAGGGGGASGNGTLTGASGGSGGGGGNGRGGGAGNTPSTSPSQGNNGGNPDGEGNGQKGGGGGGAGAVGGNSIRFTNTPGSGGIGKISLITGNSVYYAGGGAGARTSCCGSAAGGQGGGGGTSAIGVANTGGGGGGNGGNGGSGIVIVRYKLLDY